jgi:arabinogalactan oligomer/maltooligosaccharide transport system permease protein
MRFVGHRWGLTALLILQMFPATMSLASNYILLVKLGLFNSHLGYILISSGAGAYMIWFVKGYFDNIPKELDEAALVDGATRWQIFRYIMLPLVRPFIAVQVLWAIIGTFSEFMSASIFLKSPNLWLQAVGMQRMVGGAFQANQWPVFAAGAVLVSIPLVILWMFLQRHLIAGLTRGAVKG